MGTHVATPPSPRAAGYRASVESARGEGSWARAPWGILTAAVGVAVWLVVDPRTPDLAGQVYRANLFREAGFLVWDSRWYGGHDIPGYSLVFPPLGALVGVRAVGAAAVLASATLFERIVVGAYGRGARWGAVWFALAALGDAWSGRITFALGVSFALGAVLALMHRRLLAAAILAAVCAACSPVAGVLLALAGLTHTLAVRSPRSLLVLGAPTVVVVGALAGLFGEGGWEPYPLLSFLATAAAMVGFLIALPDGQRLLWIGGVVYLVACVACVGVHAPMGANVERYGVLLAGPLLLCALQSSGRRLSSLQNAGGRLSAVAVVALVGIGVWTVWGPVRETEAVAGNLSTSASYYVPVERFVATHGASTVRVEVPFTRGHWEAAWLAPKVSLARGWEKQLDERYDGVLLGRNLTGGDYHRWLDAEAVRYVALPDAPLDPIQCRRGPPDRGRAALPARRGAHAALADLRSAPRHPSRAGAGCAHRGRPRLVLAARPRGGALPGEGALHPLLHGHLRCRVRGGGAGRLDRGERSARGHRDGLRALLARPRAGAGGKLLPALARGGEVVEGGVPGEVHAVAVADNGIEGAGVHPEDDVAG